MSGSPSELSVDAVRSFIINRGGKVTNQQLVKHFKVFLTDPSNKNEARSEFKNIVNQIANVIKDDNGEKYLTLKKSSSHAYGRNSSPVLSITSSIGNEPSPSPSPTFSKYTSPPPYREPPPPVSSPITVENSGDGNNNINTAFKSPPAVPPRRKSSEKLKEEISEDATSEVEFNKDANKRDSNSDVQEQFSVKECMKKFHRLASQDSTPPKVYQPIANSNCMATTRKRVPEKNASDRDDDTDSTNSLDQRYKDWIVRAARGDYQELAKLASENHKLARYKDPATTALHWGAKHGNTDIVKLIAGTYGVNVNQRTGYTALHVAMQFEHEDVYNLLVEVYGADQNLRDWSGRKPRQYQMKNTTISSDTFRKIKGQKKTSEKDSGFLRMGSLNVKVKKTTEVVSNFLGVGNYNPDKLHKMWSSADNIEDFSRMPPPKAMATIKKRKSKSGRDYKCQMYPSSPTVIIGNRSKRSVVENEKSDSDSDTACGFDSNWKQQKS